ncbi:sodium- and chloride-dependent glycine transporter 1-like [Amphiura filiformis]|uniref:sodium- and chloride-dependent glycine transporter 1-like n=1 Tax=Amphiura filiformis TaxID=82378 RepID=UPI003B21EE31
MALRRRSTQLSAAFEPFDFPGYAKTIQKEEGKPSDENVERGNWANPIEFVLATLGAVVGLGNVWRFPYLAYRNGGGAFLIPYGIMLALAGLPLFFLELAHGQYCSEGTVTCWKVMPLIRGMSFGQLLIGAYCSISYNVVIMYSFYYFFVSFTRVLPWVGCNHNFNTALCSDLPKDCLAAGGIIAMNSSCVPLQSLTDDQLAMYNITYDTYSINDTDMVDEYDLSLYEDPLRGDRVTPSEEYWRYQVLQETDSMNDTGGLVWQLVLCLIIAWVVTYLCMIKGIDSIGKVVYFTATFPYVILVILFIRGLTLPGAVEGIKFFVVPRWHYLKNARVWLDAAVQIFYSLGVAAGALVTMASYNKFHHNCYRDALAIAVANSLTSIFAGLVIFSIIGFMAHSTGKEVDNVVSQGFGLAFMAYPEAVARMSGGPFWSICFFFMLIILGLDSQFVQMEILVTAITDMFPKLRHRKSYITASFCTILCILGFTCVTRAGGYWMAVIDQYSVNFHKLVFALAECAGLCWFYGPKRFLNDIRAMMGDKVVESKGFSFWPISWVVITPGLMLFILAFNFISWTEPQYNGPFPPWGQAIGWMIMLSSLIVIPMDWAFFIWTTPGTYEEPGTYKEVSSTQAIGWMIMLSSLIVLPMDWAFFIWTIPGTYEEVSSTQAIGWMIMLSSLIVLPMDWAFFIWTIPGTYEEVSSTQVIGWMIMLSSLIVLPMDWAFFIWTIPGTYEERFRALINPLPSWGPALRHHRQEAADVHRMHGTDFGGQVDYVRKKNDLENGPEPPPHDFCIAPKLS